MDSNSFIDRCLVTMTVYSVSLVACYPLFTFEFDHPTASRNGRLPLFDDLDDCRPVGYGDQHHVHWLCLIRVRSSQFLLGSLYRSGPDAVDSGTSLAVGCPRGLESRERHENGGLYPN